MTGLLEVRELEAAYGAAKALFGVDLSVAEGETVALMGRNGMGKTTTIRAICQLMPITGGTISFADTNLAHLPSHKAAQLGIGLVPEGRRCFADLTVYENCIAAARSAKGQNRWTFDTVSELFPRLAERREQTTSTLSGGEQQMVAIARALMTNPRLLILDEATEGLAPLVRQEIWEALGALKSSGLSMLVVDKSLDEMRRITDRCVIIERGRTCWTGTPDSLTDEIQHTYLGI